MFFTTLAFFTSFLVGFAMKRGGLCTYAAVLQIVNQRRTDRMITFLGAAAWASILIVPLSWWWPDWVSLSRVHNHMITAVSGGMVLGLGAYLNKGCIFGTFVQLVGGNLTYVTTLIGMSIGVVITHQYLTGLVPLTDANSVLAKPGFPAFYWLFAVGLFALLAMFQRKPGDLELPGIVKGFCLRRRQTIFIMLIIGIGGGLLFTTVNGWDYPSVLTKATITVLDPQAIGPGKVAMLCTLAMVVGGISASVTEGSFSIQAPKLISSLACLAGGAMMGSAAIIVPGGNDGMLLQGIPGLAPHAIVAYILMVTVMLMLVFQFRRKL